MHPILRCLSVVLCLGVLYPGGATSANADVSAAAAALEGSMQKLRFHDAPQPVAMVRFETFDGAPISLADYAGKLTIVNFWATWCAPCRKEMPMLSELQSEFGGDDFEVVTIATGRNAPNAMTRFFDQIGVDNLPLHRDPSGAVGQAMGVDALPITVVLDPEGRELARMRGDADWASDSAKAMIRALLPQG
jgi:thiol-disulfide isomerase/thioredoxin